MLQRGDIRLPFTAFKKPDVGAAGINLADLPDNLKSKYGYDPEKAKAHEIGEAEKEKANAEAIAKAVKVAEEEARIAANTVRLRGDIRQITKDGLLVFAHFGNERMPNYVSPPIGPKWLYGDFLITGYPNADGKVDGDWFDVDAVLDGVFEYTTVLGATKRIRKFRVVKSYY